LLPAVRLALMLQLLLLLLVDRQLPELPGSLLKALTS
jgi:hypothetical protein